MDNVTILKGQDTQQIAAWIAGQLQQALARGQRGEEAESGTGAENGAGAGAGNGAENGAGAGAGNGAENGAGAGAGNGAENGAGAGAGNGAETDRRVALCVPGGSTPFPIFEALVEGTASNKDAPEPIDWSRVDIWPGDDRLVEESHDASNIGRIRALFEPVGAQVHALAPLLEDREGAEADEGASGSQGLPHFALTWLGMGADGHVASLFPNTDPQADDPQRIRRLTPDPLPPEAPFDRVTLTLPALLNSDQIMLLIRGEEKGAVFHAALNQQERARDLPIGRLLAAAQQNITCFT